MEALRIKLTFKLSSFVKALSDHTICNMSRDEVSEMCYICESLVQQPPIVQSSLARLGAACEFVNEYKCCDQLYE